MTQPAKSIFNGKKHLSEALSLILLAMVMLGSWFLVHGVTKGLYEQFANLGDAPTIMGPVGEAGRNQLGHQGYFWSERAFHYRTTLIFAVDDFAPVETLAKDIAQQYPDGVNAWREYTLLMEPVYGQLYRWFGQPREILVEFLLRLIPLIHVLMFIPLYLLARALGVRPLIAALGILIYASCSMGFARLSGSLLLKENFALFWLACFLAGHFWAMRTRNFMLLGFAALSLIVFLASWHLSQFLMLVVLGPVAWFLSRHEIFDDRWNRLVPSVYLVAGMLAGFTPSLWARGFLLSLPMMLLLAWLLSAWAARFLVLQKRSLPSSVVFVGLFLVLGSLSFLNRYFQGDYNHLFGLLTHKVWHGFVRPENATSLPFDVRVFWASPFNSPTWNQIWTKLGYHSVLLLVAAGTALWLTLKKRWENQHQTLLGITVILLFGWLMIERLSVVFWPVAAVLIAVAAEQWTAWAEEKKSSSLAPVLVVSITLVAFAGTNLVGQYAPQVKVARQVATGQPVAMGASDQVVSQFRVDLLEWLRTNTPGPQSRFRSDEALAVLGEIGVSPQVLLYAQRPVVLNSQFENQPIRRRYQEFLEVLFTENPDRLKDFISEVKAGYLFINRNWATGDGPGSAAYLAGVEGPLRTGMNISRLHFNPDSFPFLHPVYNNEYYRVFRVGQPDTGPVTWERNHGNWWNIQRYTISNGNFVDLQNDRLAIQEFEHSLVALQDAQDQLLRRNARSGNPGQPPLPALHQRYLELKLQQSMAAPGPALEIQEQLNQVVRRIQDQLNHPSQGSSLGQSLAHLYTHGLSADQPGWKDLLDAEFAEPTHYASAAQLLAMLGQYSQAADLMLKASDFFPTISTVAGDGKSSPVATGLARQIRQSAVGYLVAAERAKEASALAARWKTSFPLGSPSQKFLRSVEMITMESP